MNSVAPEQNTPVSISPATAEHEKVRVQPVAGVCFCCGIALPQLINKSGNPAVCCTNKKCKSAVYRFLNPEYYKKKSSFYYQRNKINRPSWMVKQSHDNALKMRSKRITERELVYEKFGRKCNRCGFNDTRALQIDHVNGGGKNERKEFKCKMHAYYKKVLDDKNGEYQLLCANCNWIKRFTSNEIYHLNQHGTSSIFSRYVMEYEI